MPAPSYSAVRLLDPADESRVIGTISTDALLARPRDDGRTPPAVTKASGAYDPTITPVRRQKAAATLATRNRARTTRGIVAT